MNSPHEITIKTKTSTVSTLNQRYWLVSGLNKLDALSRILEAEDTDGVIVFVSTRAATVELAESLEDRGFSVAPLNGDIPQHLREQTIDRLKKKRIDILVATDVAARGLDVDRISHVINYDVPHDSESYIHRVGRTGRAGRKGEAILFISPRDRKILHGIEYRTRQRIDQLELPKTKQINDKRIASFKQKISEKIEKGELDLFKRIVQEMKDESDLDPLDIAAAAACLTQGEQPLLLPEKTIPVRSRFEDRASGRRSDRGSDRRSDRDSNRRSDRGSGRRNRKNRFSENRTTDYEMAKYRVEVGHAHGVKAGNLLGAIANEAGLDGDQIGKIMIRDDYSTIDLPVGMPSELLHELKRVRVVGQQLRITLNAHSEKHRSGKKGDSRKQRKISRSRRGRDRKSSHENKISA